MIKQIIAATTISAAALAVSAGAGRADDDRPTINHVLLISIDGMHALDFITCAKGPNPTCPHLASLKSAGVDYLEASTSKPSDSFPGLMAIVTGGSPRSVGAFYDVAYDRVLAPPQTTTWNGVAGGVCTPNQPNGTTTEYEEGINFEKSLLNGGAPAGQPGGIASIDPTRLPRDPYNNCQPVYPWNFVRTNTIFGVIHQAGGYTAWSDKHPAYSSVAGPDNGGNPGKKNLDDYFSPEINSIPVAMPGVTLPDGTSCNPLPDQNAVTSSDDYTTSFKNIQCYDTLKVNAILNQINGKKSDGTARAPVPVIFGMNFQAVSIGQKLIQKSLTPHVKGGYLDNAGTPSAPLLNEIQFVDASIGKMIDDLKDTGDYHSTLIVITAKHGQSPVDSARYQGIGVPAGSPIMTSPAMILANCLPYSESPNNPNGIGPTEDDVSLLWLDQTQQGCRTATAVSMLESASPTSGNVAGIGQIFSGQGITQMFNPPGPPKSSDAPHPGDIDPAHAGYHRDAQYRRHLFREHQEAGRAWRLLA